MPQGKSWPGESDAAVPMRNGLAVASLILGIVAIPGILILGLLDAVVLIFAIVLGILALRQVKHGLSNRRGFAIAGTALGGVALVLFVVAVVVNQHAVNDCKKTVGHTPSRSELSQCQKDKG